MIMWLFPIKNCNGIPVGHHPGAFAYRRRVSHHTGVDLYTVEGEPVHAMEDGIVTSIEHFTGAQDKSPWWENTDAVVIEGKSGAICYGEIIPNPLLAIGSEVKRGDLVGKVTPVVHKGRERPDIPGHSRSMLHIEYYKPARKKASDTWELDKPMHEYMIDPTPYLLKAEGAPKNQLVMVGEYFVQPQKPSS